MEIKIYEKGQDIQTPSAYTMPFVDYQQVDGFNSSAIRHFKKSPAHYKYQKDNPEEDTKAMIFGRAVHTAVLESEKFDNEYAVLPAGDQRTKKWKEEYAEWLKTHKGKTELREKEMDLIWNMCRSVKNQPKAFKMLQEGHAELSFFAKDRQSEARIKGRMDYIVPAKRFMADLKTTENADEDSFAATVLKYNYHAQAAFYLDLLSVITGDEWLHFAWIAVEKEPPHGVGYYTADLDLLADGRAIYRKALDTYAECIKNDEWPSYSETVKVITLPQWRHRNQWSGEKL